MSDEQKKFTYPQIIQSPGNNKDSFIIKNAEGQKIEMTWVDGKIITLIKDDGTAIKEWQSGHYDMKIIN